MENMKDIVNAIVDSMSENEAKTELKTILLNYLAIEDEVSQAVFINTIDELLKQTTEQN